MLTKEEQEVIDRLKETDRKIDEGYEAGTISEEVYQAKCKLLDEALAEMEAVLRSDDNNLSPS